MDGWLLWLHWQEIAAMGMVSWPVPVATVILSSNGLREVTRARGYYD
jgi:hypothetical protein